MSRCVCCDRVTDRLVLCEECSRISGLATQKEGKMTTENPPMTGVIDLFPNPKNLACDVCGGQWWLTDGIVIGEEGRCVAYAGPLRCAECEGGGELKVIK